MGWGGIEYRIGLRYTRSPKRNHFISFISLISILGIAVGVTSIITVLSVMNGFKQDIQAKVLNFTAHAVVTPLEGDAANWQEVYAKLEGHPQLVAASPYFELQGILKSDERMRGTLVRGIDPETEPRVSGIASYLVAGGLDDLKPQSWNIIMGEAMARALGVTLNDKVVLFSPQSQQSPAGMIPRLRRLNVSGIYQSGMNQYDNFISFIHIRDAQKIARAEQDYTGIQLRFDDLFAAPAISQELHWQLAPDFWVTSWAQRHKNFFKALEMEKLLLLIIMSLIVMVAAFNIVSSLVMLVVEKTGDIAILKTMGMTTGGIVKIFITQGFLIGLGGAAIGIVGGIALASHVQEIVAGIENLTGQQFLSPDVYPITEVPSLILFKDVVVTAAIAFSLTLLATLYPAFYASRIQPSQALRYE